MKIGILGTGGVGQTLGTALVNLGHEVKMGSRDSQNPKAQEWAAANGDHASVSTFAEAASFGEIILLATLWTGTENALHLADSKNLAGKVVVDITNPLQFGPEGPSLSIGFTDSAGEQVQRWLPESHVVKAFNHMPVAVMVDANALGEEADLFICGNDAAAKQKVSELVKSFGFTSPIDLGGIEQSRLTEALTGLWVRYYVISQNWQHTIKLIRKS